MRNIQGRCLSRRRIASEIKKKTGHVPAQRRKIFHDCKFPHNFWTPHIRYVTSRPIMPRQLYRLVFHIFILLSWFSEFSSFDFPLTHSAEDHFFFFFFLLLSWVDLHKFFLGYHWYHDSHLKRPYLGFNFSVLFRSTAFIPLNTGIPIWQHWSWQRVAGRFFYI